MLGPPTRSRRGTLLIPRGRIGAVVPRAYRLSVQHRGSRKDDLRFRRGTRLVVDFGHPLKGS